MIRAGRDPSAPIGSREHDPLNLKQVERPKTCSPPYPARFLFDQVDPA